jgi:amphi-Trp domain-containing protein
MAKKNVLVKSKERRDVQSIATFLRELADRLERQELVLQRGSDEVRLAIPGTVVFALKAKEKTKKRKTKQRLGIKIKWVEGDSVGDRLILG